MATENIPPAEHLRLIANASSDPLFTKETYGHLISSTKELKRTLWNIFYYASQLPHIANDDTPPERQIIQVRPLQKILENNRAFHAADYAIIIGGILKSLDIRYNFKIVAFKGEDFQHVYVIVPSADHEKGYYVLDPMMKEFDTEVENISKAYIQ